MRGHFTGWIDRILARPIRYLFETPGRLLKGYVEPGMTVLDVGCGTGYYSLGMARLVGSTGRVVAVDTQGEVVAALEKRGERAGLGGRIEARVSEEQDLGVSDLSGCVDFALAVYVLHHASNIPGFVAAVHRALKSGGRLLVVEPSHHASAAERETIEGAARGAGFLVANHPRLKRDWAVVLVKGE